jgi:predicted methyltransferase
MLRWATLMMLAAGYAAGVSAASVTDALGAGHRPAEERARDAARHPVETLAFFGLAPEMTVVELWPGRGWYTAVLAPVLEGEGRLVAAQVPADAPQEYARRLAKVYADRLAADPDVYGEVEVVSFLPPDRLCLGAPGSADLVLTFRNLHNWLAAGALDDVLAAAYAVLREGGTLGVVEHRAAPGTALEAMKKTGYVTEAYAIERAQAAGFRLVEKSEINANPGDTKDHPEGVWTLPPTLRLGEQDRDRYLGIGESDRMTLRFEKPAGGPPARDFCARP